MIFSPVAKMMTILSMCSLRTDMTAAEVRTNFKGCVDPAEVSDCEDYFPEKVSPQFSKQWNMTYHRTYKILYNHQVNESYLMYQCGTTPPESEKGKHNLEFAVPLQDGVAVTQTTNIPQFEQLGLRRQVKAYVGSSAYVSSPCFNTLLEAGDMDKVYDPTNAWHPEEGIAVDTYLKLHPDLVIIHGSAPDHTSASNGNDIIVSEWAEGDNRAIFEWHKVYGSLFNLEKEANDQFEDSSSRFDCGTSNAKHLATTVLSDKEKPTVLWATFTDYVGYDGTPVREWTVATCDPKYNYYCEFADHCYSNLLHSDKAMDLEEFIEFGKKADVWIYTGFNWDDVYAEFGSNLTDFVSVQNEKVYDLLASGSGPWFEQRMAEYDVVLQDFCAAVGHNNEFALPHKRQYLRKALPLGIEAVGDLGTCSLSDIDVQWKTRASTCTYLDPDAEIPEQPKRLGSDSECVHTTSKDDTTKGDTSKDDTTKGNTSKDDKSNAKRAGSLLLSVFTLAFWTVASVFN